MKRKKWQIVFSSMFLSLTLIGCANAYEDGMEALENGEYEEAVTHLSTAVERERHLADSYRGLGIAYWELGSYEEAFTSLQAALDQGAEETAALYGLLGNCAFQLEEYEAAISYYGQALDVGDGSAELTQEVQFNTIAAYEQLQDYEQAREKLDAYLSAYPEDQEAAKEAAFLETR